jgi:hypothetical protein
MAKPTRSPLLGYNHNVKYKGRIYHAQSEDSGPANPHLFTHLYYEGTIVATKRHEYDRESSDEIVRGLMQGQHKAILKELRHGVHDERLAGFFRTRNQPLVADDGPLEGTDPGEAERKEMRTEATTTLPEMVAFDLDALPTSLTDTPNPELLPQPAQLPAGGPGIYVMRASREYPTLEASTPTGIRGPRPSEPLMPLVIFDENPGMTPPLPPRPAQPPASNMRPSRMPPGLPPGMPPPSERPTRPFAPPPEATNPSRPSRPLGTPPPLTVPRVHPGQMPSGPPPVRPPVNAGVAVPVRPVISAGTPRPNTSEDGGGVVVQRQVGIGSPSMARPGAGLRRRPAPPVPYVVKEGTHPIVGQPPASGSLNRSSTLMTPAAPMVPPVPPAARTNLASAPHPDDDNQITADKSLDEVILAYLSQGDGTD